MKLDTTRADAQKPATPKTEAAPASFASEYLAYCRDLLQREGPVIWRNLNPVAEPAAAAAVVQEQWEALCQQVCDHMTEWLYQHGGIVKQWPHPACGAFLTARTRRGKLVQGAEFQYFGAPLEYDPQTDSLVAEDPWLKPRCLRYTASPLLQRPLANAWHISCADKKRQPYLDAFRELYKRETEGLWERWQKAEDDWEAEVQSGKDAAACQAAERQALQLRKAYAEASDMHLWRQRFAEYLDTGEYRACSREWQQAKAWTAGHAARVEEYLAAMRLRDEKMELCAAWQQAWFAYLCGQGLPARAVLTLEEGEMPR